MEPDFVMLGSAAFARILGLEKAITDKNKYIYYYK